VRLRPGDRIIAFTTGVMDALAPGPHGSAEAELLEIARDHEATDSRDLAGAILNRIAYTNAMDSSRDRSLVVVSKKDMMSSMNRSAARRELAMAY
jgi:serine phosphatase RsbU (regulator of sigma subunit)